MTIMTIPTLQNAARLRMPASAFAAAAQMPNDGRHGSTCVYTKLIGIDVPFVDDVPGIRSWSPPV